MSRFPPLPPIDPELLAALDIEQDLIPDDNKLRTVSQLAEQQKQLEARIVLAAAELEKLAQQHKTLSEKTLPEAMVDAGVLEFTLIDGSKIVVEDGMSLSVPKKNMAQVCLWLRENGHGDVIKHEIVVPIPKGADSDDKVAKVEASLIEQDLEYSKEENVHSGTLKALLKEQREQGAEIDLKLFGAFEWRKASVVLPKAKKVKL